jgi:DNA-binding NtrC family response regulator
MSGSALKAPKTILLIDDDDLIAGSLRQVLQMDGCDVDVAVDPGSAASLMSKKSYDIVVVDPYLTGGVHREDGDLIAHIRTLQPAANLVVLTGYGSPELDRSASDGGVSAILTKPQSVVFLSQFLVAAANPAAMTPQPSIKGQPA